MAGGLLVCKWSAQQVTMNQRAAACGKGVGYTFRQEKPSPYMIEGEGGRFGSTKRKHIIVRCGLHNDAWPGEPDKKSGDVAAPPGGGGMPLRRQIY
jgi:hypothetical protein